MAAAGTRGCGSGTGAAGSAQPYLDAGSHGADLLAQPQLLVAPEPLVGCEVLEAVPGLWEGCTHQQHQRVRLGLQQLQAAEGKGVTQIVPPALQWG